MKLNKAAAILRYQPSSGSRAAWRPPHLHDAHPLQRHQPAVGVGVDHLRAQLVNLEAGRRGGGGAAGRGSARCFRRAGKGGLQPAVDARDLLLDLQRDICKTAVFAELASYVKETSEPMLFADEPSPA